MSSRQEEKQRRREERIAKEQAEAAAAARKHRLGLVAAGLLGAAAVAAVIIAIAAAAGGGSDSSKSTGPSGDTGIPNKPVPAQKIADLDKAAAAAGCTVKTFPSAGRSHTTDTVTYKTNPPTSGNHAPTPADDGTYAPGQTPAVGPLVHTLEHGRVEIQYAPDTSPTRIGQLQSLMDEDGYHALLVENNTRMPYAVAATAWTHLLGCKKFTDKSFDAIRAFRKRYTDQAPEAVP